METIIDNFTDLSLNNNLNDNSNNLLSKKNIKTRGTGAGGKNTNKNGLNYEKITDLSNDYNIVKIILKDKKKYKKIKFKDEYSNENKYIVVNQFNFMKYLNDKQNKDIKPAHGCKNPDECYINEDTNTIYIIEKKFQQCSGSVCEKIQTGDFKRYVYSLLFPSYKIIYIYCLSDWFKINCPTELNILENKYNIPILFGSDENYKQKIINILNK